MVEIRGNFKKFYEFSLIIDCNFPKKNSQNEISGLVSIRTLVNNDEDKQSIIYDEKYTDSILESLEKIQH